MNILQASTPAYPDRMPGAGEIIAADVQVWHNPKVAGSRSPKPEWVVKFTTWTNETAAIAERAGANWFFCFRDARRMRHKIATDRAKAAIPPGWADRLMDACDLPAHSLIAYAATKLTGKPAADTYPMVVGAYALLHLDEARQAPAEIEIHLGQGHNNHLRITKFIEAAATVQSGRRRRANAPGWIAYHDPGSVRVAARRERAALNRAAQQDKTAVSYSPTTALGQLVATMIDGRIEAYNEQVCALERDHKARTERTSRLILKIASDHDATDELVGRIARDQESLERRIMAVCKEISSDHDELARRFDEVVGNQVRLHLAEFEARIDEEVKQAIKKLLTTPVETEDVAAPGGDGRGAEP